MKRKFLLYFLSAILFNSCNSNTESSVISNTPESSSEEIHFFSADSVKVYADLYQQNLQTPTILLFHQGGANVRSEYNPIIPKLLEDGFNILAVDLRVGGQLFGSYNRTVADIGVNQFNYCDAYPDLEASLNYLKNKDFIGNIILWGSSFSASLVIKLADENPDKVAAVLAFSPASGEPMEGCEPNRSFRNFKNTHAFITTL